MSKPQPLAGFRVPRIAYEVNEDSTVVNMVVQGLGQLFSVAAEPLPPGVHVCSLPVPLENRVAVLANTLQTPAVFAFLDTRSADRFLSKRQFDLCVRVMHADDRIRWL